MKLYQSIEATNDVYRYKVYSSLAKAKEDFLTALDLTVQEFESSFGISIPIELKHRWARDGYADFSELPEAVKNKMTYVSGCKIGVFELDEGKSCFAGDIERYREEAQASDDSRDYKREFVGKLLPVIQATAAGSDVKGMEYCLEKAEDSEFVLVRFKDGTTKLIDITGHGCLSIMRDISLFLV